MRNIFMSAFVALAFLPISVLAAVPVTVNGGTPLDVRIVDAVSSDTAKIGDTFEFKADDEVDSNGYVVIARGAEGRGEVTSVERAAGNGHAGNLGLKFDYVYAVDGEKIRLSNTKKSDQGETTKGASSTATVAAAILLGPIGFFAHNWVKGKNVTIDSSKTFTTFVDDTVHVQSNQRAVQAVTGGDGYAH